jgi:hypothetical protein
MLHVQVKLINCHATCVFVAEQVFTQALHGSALWKLFHVFFLPKVGKINAQWGDNAWLSNL